MASDDGAKALERAALFVDSHQSKDEKIPELWDLLSASDANDYSSDPLVLFNKQSPALIPLPEPLVELYTQSLECASFMGLFPEIKRAWMTIDEQLCIWSYEDTRELEIYAGLSQLILSVALVRAKRSVFAPEVEWLVVLSTPVEVVLLAVIVGANGLMTYKPTHAAATVTNMVKIQGSSDGRIFMAGRDGNLYEFEYRQAPGYFTQMCQVINRDSTWKRKFVPSFISSSLMTEDPLIDIAIDSTRNILYTLSRSNVISVYDIAANRVSRVFREPEVAKKLSTMAPPHIRADNLRIVQLVAIPPTESLYVHLMAVTATGARLYFTTHDKGPGVKVETPNALLLIWTRPAPASFGDRDRTPTDIASVFYARGTLLVAEPRTEETDSLLCIAPDTAAIASSVEQPSDFGALQYQRRTRLMERAVNLTIESRTLAIAEVPRRFADANKLNELATQHMGGPRQFLCLTSKGLQVITELRPVDQLADLLANNRDDEVAKFFDRFGAAQGCAMALHLACLGSSNPSKGISSPVMDNAARIFFRYLGKPQVDGNREPRVSPYGVPATQSLFMPTNVMGGGAGMGAALSTLLYNYSSGHTGFAFFLSRLLRPIWHHYITDIVASTSLSRNIISPDVLATIETSLAALSRFISNNPQFIQIQRGRGMMDSQSIQTKEDAIKAEQSSLADMYALLKRALDAVRLLEILSPTISQVLPKTSQEQRDTILKTRFRDMVISSNGADVAKNLIASMIALFTEQNQDIEMLCGKLAERAPTFFSAKERTRIKADDLLRRVGSPLTEFTTSDIVYSQKMELLKSALKLYLSIVPDFDINYVCTEFRRKGYYSGIIELAVAYVSAADPNNLAQAYYNEDDKRDTGLASKEIYDKCVNAYQTVVEVLDELYMKEAYVDAKEDVLSQALKIDDELLQHTIFQWYVERGRADELLQLNHSKYLSTFLSRCHTELYAQYLIKNGRPADAAQLYVELAETGPGTIKQRVDWLARAHSCMESSGSHRDFTDLTDKLEVAMIQLKIWNELPDSPARKDLDDGLYDVSKLYNNYAKPAALLEAQLDIIRTARHMDPVLIKSIWDAIINRELVQSTVLDTPSSPPTSFQSPSSPLSLPPRQHTQMNQLVATVKKVATTAFELNRADNVFPLGYLLDKLEKLALEAGDTQGTVVKTMHDVAQVPYQALWEAYKEIRKTSAFWQQRTKTHLLSVLTTLLEEWANSSKTDYNEQQQFNALKVDSAIDELLSDLNTMPTADAGACDMRLRALRKTCDRLPPVPRLMW